MKQTHPHFLDLLAGYRNIIGYDPFPYEPNPNQLFNGIFLALTIPKDPNVDPIGLANRVSKMFEHTSVCVYIPATAFDKHGTRHGRGGGWYDRFLAHTPSEWMRVGLCFETNFSPVPLKREPWDQPVDWVCVQKANGIDYYNTNARASL